MLADSRLQGERGGAGGFKRSAAKRDIEVRIEDFAYSSWRVGRNTISFTSTPSGLADGEGDRPRERLGGEGNLGDPLADGLSHVRLGDGMLHCPLLDTLSKIDQTARQRTTPPN